MNLTVRPVMARARSPRRLCKHYSLFQVEIIKLLFCQVPTLVGETFEPGTNITVQPYA